MTLHGVKRFAGVNHLPCRQCGILTRVRLDIGSFWVLSGVAEEYNRDNLSFPDTDNNDEANERQGTWFLG